VTSAHQGPGQHNTDWKVGCDVMLIQASCMSVVSSVAACESAWQLSPWFSDPKYMHRAGHSIDGSGLLPRACCRPSVVLQSLVEFYGVEASFPLTTHLITRSLETTYPKRLYFVSCFAQQLVSLTCAVTAHGMSCCLSKENQAQLIFVLHMLLACMQDWP
jgi:hypothetical protein